jgi:hypothetical protein
MYVFQWRLLFYSCSIISLINKKQRAYPAAQKLNFTEPVRSILRSLRLYLSRPLLVCKQTAHSRHNGPTLLPAEHRVSFHHNIQSKNEESLQQTNIYEW